MHKMLSLKRSSLTVPPSQQSPWREPHLLALALIFMIKALFLAYFVIPPADTPDESGHYAYVRDIANGNLFPLLSEAEIPNNLFLDVPFNPAQHRPNYIAQHPPLYYFIAALPLVIAEQFTADRWYLVRAVRSVSGVATGLLFLALYCTLLAAGVRRSISLLVACSIMVIPMVGNLSAGITNDVLLFLLCALATLYLVRFCRHQSLKDAYWCALWLTLAGGTKMTAWPMIGLFIAILAFELRGTWWHWLKHMAAVTAVSLLLPLWWMLRNLYHFGSMFKVNTSGLWEPKDPSYRFIQYITEQPFLDWMLVHFYGLFGFSGYCQSVDKIAQCRGVVSTRVANEAFEFFVALLILGCVVFFWHGFTTVRRQQSTPVQVASAANPPQKILWQIMSWRWVTVPLFGLLMIISVAAVYLGLQILPREPGWPAFFGMSAMLLLLPIASLYLWLLPQESRVDDRLIAYGVVTVFLFSLLFTAQAYKGYMITSELKGVQGRYFYPFLPLLMVSLALALDRARIPIVLMLWAVIGLAVGEFHSYVTQIIPFFERVRI